MRLKEIITEGLGSETGLDKRTGVLSAIFNHIRQQIESDMTRAEFNSSYRALANELRFPMKIYRAMAFGDDHFFDIHTDNIDDYDNRDVLKDAIRGINFNAVGVSWTFNRASARAGGVIGGGAFNDDGAHVILEATISAKQCDLLTTLYQNLTVFQEEQEIRLFPNINITITGITPDVGLNLPIKASTGPEKYDTRDAVVRDLVNAMKRPLREGVGGYSLEAYANRKSPFGSKDVIEEPGFLYHGTAKVRLPHIRREGLVPATKSRFARDPMVGEWSIGKVFFTTSADSAKFYATEASRTAPLLLRVPENAIADAAEDHKESNAVYVSETVPAKVIEYWSGKAWKAI